MTQDRRLSWLLLGGLIPIAISAVLLVTSQSAGARGHIDQSNVAHSYGALNIGAYPPVAQSFTASSSGQLEGVSLALTLTWDDAQITVRIRDTDLRGQVLGSESRTLLLGRDPGRWEYFSFDPPIPVQQGRTYLIEAVTPARPGIAWFETGIMPQEPDNYPGGIAFIDGYPDLSRRRDFIFQTCVEGSGKACFQSGRHLWPEVLDRPARSPQPKGKPTATPDGCIDFGNGNLCPPWPSGGPTPTPCIDFSSGTSCEPF